MKEALDLWLTADDQIPEVIFEDGMIPVDDDAAVAIRNGTESPKSDDAGETARRLPIVCIGRPEVWGLREIMDFNEVPRTVHVLCDEWNFYLVRLYCSFRSRRDDVVMEWARFLARFPEDEHGRQPITFDLHPADVTEETKRNFRVSLTPNLKFHELEASIGEVDFGIEYRQIQPIITAIAPGLPEASWDFEATKHIPLSGGKWMHLLLKAPKEMSKAVATLDLVADVRIRSHRLALASRREESDRLVVNLW